MLVSHEATATALTFSKLYSQPERARWTCTPFGNADKRRLCRHTQSMIIVRKIASIRSYSFDSLVKISSLYYSISVLFFSFLLISFSQFPMFAVGVDGVLRIPKRNV
ncbi:uncharacterized protein BDV17DRAFT_272758 [Aspergillus undulatus]|uniref:uncharacterized protein n=1 Tax=Aspergillus undulatus TaxID=1810928 RepID=UPI003CCE2647